MWNTQCLFDCDPLVGVNENNLHRELRYPVDNEFLVIWPQPTIETDFGAGAKYLGDLICELCFGAHFTNMVEL